jgi:general secretion pathway protein G
MNIQNKQNKGFTLTSKMVRGFTLIELLITIAIIALLTAMSVFALSGARESARDGRRKTDLEQIKTALEFYKSDCNVYPTGIPTVGNALTSSCTGVTNTYIQKTPGDPTTNSAYTYCPAAGNLQYTISAHLEGGTSSVSACGSCTGGTCNYQVTNP